ncbi:uncharacterized protein si:dkey-192g7.3 isoform X2 [Megalops cyprinoides]|uniref:uncharacterized protein si:dkey-192g7.3 isoform X2 n=1 Tax=Megalops cyprinoides TaxID=118141 RepID=UPI0018644830|nr:uncharacterized protein si:dkey-192g7.3 isoform X2 [Megalops cyprinoides]
MHGTLSTVTGKRMATDRITTIMWTALILLVSAHITVSNENTIEATAGQDVLLPCACPKNDDHYLVWQIQGKAVDYYIREHKNKSNISDQFEGRTRLFFSDHNRNCSLLLLGVTMADMGTYTCYYKNPEYEEAKVNLRISEKREITNSTVAPPTDKTAAYAVSGVILVLIGLLAVILIVRFRDRRLKFQAVNREPVTPSWV